MVKYVNGVNPKALAQWKEEDRQERAKACSELLDALFKLERLYQVSDESDHPLEKAYELIYDFAESENILP